MVKKVLVIGSSGFIGSNICRLLRSKYNVVGVDDLSFGSTKNEFVATVYKNAKYLEPWFLNRFDVIVSSFCSNLIYGGNYPNETYKNNVITAINLFSRFNGHVINLSTSSIYGNSLELPIKETHSDNTRNAYDTSKLIVEYILRERGNYTTFRLSNVYGEYQRPENPYVGVVSKFIHNKLSNKPCLVYGDNTRDYTYVGDVVDAIEKALHKPLNTEINIGTGVETSTVDLAKKIGADYNITEEIRKIDGISRRFLDSSKAKELLGWEAKTSLETGIKKTEEWIKKEYFFVAG